MQRYFLEENYEKRAEYLVSGEPYHHMARVLRMKPEERVYLVFADHVTIIGEITEISEDTVHLIEVAKETMDKEMPISITIASGFPKGDKLELITQKGTELGAAAFHFFPSDTSVVKWDEKKRQKKQQRLAKIAQEAAEQSQRQVTPPVELLKSKQDLLAEFSQYDYVLAAYEESAKEGETAKLAEVLQKMRPGERMLAIFGPEGGLTPVEVAEFTAAGAVLCGLGPRILRTETAPFYLLSAASYVSELADKTN